MNAWDSGYIDPVLWAQGRLDAQTDLPALLSDRDWTQFVSSSESNMEIGKLSQCVEGGASGQWECFSSQLAGTGAERTEWTEAAPQPGQTWRNGTTQAPLNNRVSTQPEPARFSYCQYIDPADLCHADSSILSRGRAEHLQTGVSKDLRDYITRQIHDSSQLADHAELERPAGRSSDMHAQKGSFVAPTQSIGFLDRSHPFNCLSQSFQAWNRDRRYGSIASSITVLSKVNPFAWTGRKKKHRHVQATSILGGHLTLTTEFSNLYLPVSGEQNGARVGSWVLERLEWYNIDSRGLICGRSDEQGGVCQQMSYIAERKNRDHNGAVEAFTSVCLEHKEDSFEWTLNCQEHEQLDLAVRANVVRSCKLAKDKKGVSTARCALCDEARRSKKPLVTGELLVDNLRAETAARREQEKRDGAGCTTLRSGPTFEGR